MSSSHQNGANYKIQAVVNGTSIAAIVTPKRKVGAHHESSSNKIARVATTIPSDRVVAIKKAIDSFIKSKATTLFDTKLDSYHKVWGILDAYEIFNLEDGGLSSKALDRAHNTVL